jgi:hypothetical protein
MAAADCIVVCGSWFSLRVMWKCAMSRSSAERFGMYRSPCVRARSEGHYNPSSQRGAHEAGGCPRARDLCIPYDIGTSARVRMSHRGGLTAGIAWAAGINNRTPNGRGGVDVCGRRPARREMCVPFACTIEARGRARGCGRTTELEDDVLVRLQGERAVREAIVHTSEVRGANEDRTKRTESVGERALVAVRARERGGVLLQSTLREVSCCMQFILKNTTAIRHARRSAAIGGAGRRDGGARFVGAGRSALSMEHGRRADGHAPRGLVSPHRALQPRRGGVERPDDRHARYAAHAAETASRVLLARRNTPTRVHASGLFAVSRHAAGGTPPGEGSTHDSLRQSLCFATLWSLDPSDDLS